ncbi:methyltransferase family protein [Roseibium hamelinense]|uniref:Methyltransferase family protein n=1 Tax=Roseibium hamelinense TaxID=150831 RepID=A0A562T7K5_9HYPH|nr:class I SAM-dependent methyltransferase [Roseibium hamelinense]MTI42337.1 class I SAM-dependent methyltransferase [Roseibium hamelinense]TWI89575.1 methyltransferase family protein [Roseibium hamelinense]
MQLTRDHIDTLYRKILLRAPEAEQAYEYFLENFKTVQEAQDFLLSSPEFQANQSRGDTERKALQLYQMDRGPMSIQFAVDSTDLENLKHTFRNLRETAGLSEPYHHEMPDGRFFVRPFRITEHDFWATGLPRIEKLLKELKMSEADLPENPDILEIGCGVGRLSFYLANQAGHLDAADWSEPHLNIARERSKRFMTETLRFLDIDSQANQLKQEYDLICTGDGFWHLPPVLMRDCLSGQLRRLKSGGTAYLTLPVFIKDYSYETLSWINDPGKASDRHPLPQEVLLSVIAESGLTVKSLLETRDFFQDQPIFYNTVIAVRG